jgi:hypothetical protein
MGRTTTVIARLDRATQYAAAAVIDPRCPGVLDHPLLRVTTVIFVIASEAKQSRVRKEVWIASSLCSSQ